MAYSSFNTKTISLSSTTPDTTSYTVSSSHVVYGNTQIILDTSNISVTGYGIKYASIVTSTDTISTISPSISGNTFTLPQTSFNYTYFIGNTAVDVDKLYFTVFYRNSLYITHEISMFSIPENILNMDINILNTQLMYISGSVVSLINLESKDNIVYPVSF